MVWSFMSKIAGKGAGTQVHAPHIKVYLDHAAMTPIDPAVASAVKAAEKHFWMNPSSIHQGGVASRKAVDAARARIAACINAHPQELYFTGSGTEANNLALQGIVQQFHHDRRGPHRGTTAPDMPLPHILISRIEHPSIRSTVAALAEQGLITFSECKVNHDGKVNLDALTEHILPETILVSVMLANNETGVIQPVRDIAKIVRHARKLRSDAATAAAATSTANAANAATPMPLYLHTDASQAAEYITIDVATLGADLITFDAHKLYGPRGIGMLWVRRGVSLAPLLHGGGQEKGMRSGTENVPAIIGLAEAFAISRQYRAGEAARLIQLRDYCIEKILERHLSAKLVGNAIDRLPNNVCMVLPFDDAEWTVLQLDAHGIACATRSACEEAAKDGSSTEGSNVALAMGFPPEAARRVVRFTLGRTTTARDIDKLLHALLLLRHGRTY